MKVRGRHLPALVVCFFSGLSPARADNQTWISANADNTWSSSAANWDAGVAWTSGNSAIFGGTGETVTISGATSADSVKFDTSGYTVAGSTLTLAGSQTVQVTNSADSVTFTAPLAGGTLNKTGSGTLILNAANTLSTVNVSAGTLAITGQYTSNRLSSGAVVQVASGATVDIRTENPLPTTNSQNVTAFVLNGGTLTSTGGTHTHLGAITLNGGTLTTGSGSGTYDSERWKVFGDFTVGGSSVSTISGSGVGLVGNRTFTVADVTGNTNVDLTVTANLNNGELSTGGLIKAGAGRMNLGTSSFTGPTTVNAGHLAVSGTLLGTSSILVNSGATLELGATNMFVSGHGIAVDSSRVIQVSGGTLLLNSSMDSRIGNVTLGNGATWTSNRALSGYDVLFGNTSAGAATVSVANTAGNTSASLMNGTGGIHLGGVQNFDVADVTGNANADLTVSMTLDNAGTTGGTGGINKTGAGTMAISQRTTYTGGTTVAAGVLDLTGGGGAAGTIRGTATVQSGATLRLSTGDATGYSTDSTRLSTIELNGGTLDVNTTSNQTLGSAAIRMTGGAITGIANSNLDFFGGSSALSTLASANSSVISGVALSPLRQGSTTFDVADGGAAVDLRIDSVLRNSPSGNAAGSVLIKSGAGTMRLTANNTISNGLTINAGVVDISANGLYRDSAGGAAYNLTAVVTINAGGTLKLKSFEYNGDGGLGGLRDYAANRVINGGVLEVYGATHSSGNDFTVGSSGGTFRYNPTNTADVLTLTGNSNTDTVLNGALTFDAVGNITASDNLSGSGSLTKTGAGTLRLSGLNTYSGITTISAGTLSLGHATDTLDGAITVSGGTLDVDNPDTVGVVTLTSGTISGDSVLTASSFALEAGTVSAALGGNGTLTKTGAGTVTLNAATTYSGNTVVSAGTLALGAGGGLASSGTVSIAQGASLNVTAQTGGFTLGASQTLAGGGTVVGDSTVLGTHAPGFSPGEQTFNGDLAYGAGSSIDWELVANTTAGRGVSWDAITVTGDLSFNGATTLTPNFAPTGSTVSFADAMWSSALGLNGGGWRIFDVGGSISGLSNLSIGGSLEDSNGTAFASALPGLQFTFYQYGGDVYLTTVAAIPEPASALTLVVVLSGGALLRRRR